MSEQFIIFETTVRDGENEYSRKRPAKVTISPTAEHKTVNDALKQFLINFFDKNSGYDENDHCVYGYGGTVAISLEGYQEIPKADFEVLTKYLLSTSFEIQQSITKNAQNVTAEIAVTP